MDSRPATVGMNNEKKGSSHGVNVKVVLRCRPMTCQEQMAERVATIECKEASKEVVCNCGLRRGAGDHHKTYVFDGVCGPDTSQKKLFNSHVEPLVDEVLQGFNCTIFAYGQTGTGKTFTMEGTWTENLTSEPPTPNSRYKVSGSTPMLMIPKPEGTGSKSASTTPHNSNSAIKFTLPGGVGVIPRSVASIFERLSQQDNEYSVRVSFLEIYNEELVDLLHSEPSAAESLRIYDLPAKSGMGVFDAPLKGGLSVKGLLEIPVETLPDVYKILSTATKKRRTAETSLNRQSSRSHSIFTITTSLKELNPDGEEIIRIGKLNLVDLAGSENIQRSGTATSKDRTKEAGMINQSLVALGRVINALTGPGQFVPYRDSKLTRLLQDSLGGRTKTCIIATVSPSQSCLEETISTLDYAHRAKNIKNRPEVNQKVTQKFVLKEMSNEVEKLKKELALARDRSGDVVLTTQMFNELENEAVECQALKKALSEIRRESLVLQDENLHWRNQTKENEAKLELQSEAFQELVRELKVELRNEKNLFEMARACSDELTGKVKELDERNLRMEAMKSDGEAVEKIVGVLANEGMKSVENLQGLFERIQVVGERIKVGLSDVGDQVRSSQGMLDAHEIEFIRISKEMKNQKAEKTEAFCEAIDSMISQIDDGNNLASIFAENRTRLESECSKVHDQLKEETASLGLDHHFKKLIDDAMHHYSGKFEEEKQVWMNATEGLLDLTKNLKMSLEESQQQCDEWRQRYESVINENLDRIFIGAKEIEEMQKRKQTELKLKMSSMMDQSLRVMTDEMEKIRNNYLDETNVQEFEVSEKFGNFFKVFPSIQSRMKDLQEGYTQMSRDSIGQNERSVAEYEAINQRVAQLKKFNENSLEILQELKLKIHDGRKEYRTLYNDFLVEHTEGLYQVFFRSFEILKNLENVSVAQCRGTGTSFFLNSNRLRDLHLDQDATMDNSLRKLCYTTGNMANEFSQGLSHIKSIVDRVEMKETSKLTLICQNFHENEKKKYPCLESCSQIARNSCRFTADDDLCQFDGSVSARSPVKNNFIPEKMIIEPIYIACIRDAIFGSEDREKQSFLTNEEKNMDIEENGKFNYSDKDKTEFCDLLDYLADSEPAVSALSFNSRGNPMQKKSNKKSLVLSEEGEIRDVHGEELLASVADENESPLNENNSGNFPFDRLKTLLEILQHNEKINKEEEVNFISFKHPKDQWDDDIDIDA